MSPKNEEEEEEEEDGDHKNWNNNKNNNNDRRKNLQKDKSPIRSSRNSITPTTPTTASTPNRPRSRSDANYGNDGRSDCDTTTTTTARKIPQQQRQQELPSLIPFTPDSNHSILLHQEEDRDRPTHSSITNQNIITTTAAANASIILLTRQIQMLGTALGISVILFLFLLLPSLGASIALGFCGISTILLGQSLLQYGTLYFQRELSHLINDRGVISYLPSTLQQYFTTTSFHEYMQDGTFLRDNYYFLLYFLPGLTMEQQTHFIQQLPTHHRELLFHPGFLSLILPPSTYPWLFGNTAQLKPPPPPPPQLQQPTVMDSTTALLPPTPTDNSSVQVPNPSTTSVNNVSYNDAVRAIFRSILSWMEWIIVPNADTTSIRTEEEEELFLIRRNDTTNNNNIRLQPQQQQQQPLPDLVWTLAAESDDEEEEDGLLQRVTPPLITSSNEARTTTTTTTTTPQEEVDIVTTSHQQGQGHEEPYVLEEQIVNDAISTAITNITSSLSTSITTYVTNTIISTLDQWIPTVTRIGMFSSLVLFGLAYVRPMFLPASSIRSTTNNNNNNMHTLRNISTISTYSGIVVWSIGLFSTSMIGSAAAMMLIRSNARAAHHEAQLRQQQLQQTSSADNLVEDEDMKKDK